MQQSSLKEKSQVSQTGAGTNRTTVPSQLNGNVHDQSTNSMLLQDNPTTVGMTAS